MAQTGLIQVRVDESLKKEVDILFADLGFDTPTAIRIFLKRALEHKGIPFEVASQKQKTELMPPVRSPFKYGSMSGRIWISDDFKEPLADFEDYM